MTIFDVFPLIFGGLACALSFGMFVAGRSAIRRIQDFGREDPSTLRRLALIRFLTGSIVLVGMFISASLLLLQIDLLIGLFGPADDAIGFLTFLACVAWFIHVYALGFLVNPKRDRTP